MKLSCFVLVLLIAFPVLGQEEPPSIFGEEIDVRVINVEVVVTDGKGNRVTDLKPGDFRLKVDGKPVSIEYFTEIHEGQAVAAPTPEGQATPETVAAGPAVEPGAPVGTHYLVFVDDYFLIASKRNDVLRSLKRDLSGLGPADRMSILAWDGGRLSRLADWTGSREELAKAFDQAMARTTRGIDRMAEHQKLLRDVAFTQSVGDVGAILGKGKGPGEYSGFSGLTLEELAYGAGLARQVGSAVSAVVSAMRGSAAPPGRKVLLLLGGGWPYSIASYIHNGKSAALTHELPSGEELFGPLARTANLLGYTIYPVDVPGLTSVAADATENPMEGRGSVIMGASTGAQLQGEMPSQLTDFKSLLEQELQGPLEFLAKETGGKPLLNGNRTLALAKVQSDTRSYYWLGFSPGWKRNDKSHRIKVEALRPGLTVRSRRDFLDLSKQAEVAMKLESALLFGGDISGISGIAGSERLALRVGIPVPAKKVKGKSKGFEVPVTLGIPVSAMTVLPAGDKYAAELELRFVATDDRGNQSDIPSIPVKLSSSQPPPEGGIVRYETKVLLNGKATRLVAAVYDRASGKIAAAESEIGVK